MSAEREITARSVCDAVQSGPRSSRVARAMRVEANKNHPGTNLPRSCSATIRGNGAPGFPALRHPLLLYEDYNSSLAKAGKPKTAKLLEQLKISMSFADGDPWKKSGLRVGRDHSH